MKFYYKIPFIIATILLFAGCERDIEGLDEATYPSTPEIFIDGFSAGLNYAAFGGSDVKAFEVDKEVSYSGTASMRIAVPDRNDPKGAYAGGVYFTSVGRDLSSYNVLTFWAKASKSANIDLIGFGNDLGENKYQAAISAVPVNTNWQKYYIPIPDPSKLKNERGMFFYSEGAEEDRGYTFWIDEVRFESLGTVKNIVGGIQEGKDVTVTAETGATYTVDAFASANLPNGIDQKVQAARAYFVFSSSNPSVASVSDRGEVKVMDAGNAVITATLGGEQAKGSLTVNSTGAPVLPSTAAPKPTQAPDKVISIFSNEYDDVPVDFFNGYWQFSTTQIADVQVNGDDIKRYSQLNFVGIQFTNPTINATEMTHFHLDFWTPDNLTASSVFKILLVDIGADGSFDGSDNTSHEITIPSSQLKKDTWVSIDLPFSSFPGLKSRSHLAQIVLSGDVPNVFVDNIYFYKGGSDGGTGPTVAAPSPTLPASSVISLFSDVYTNVTVDTWRTDWSSAKFEDVSVAGDAVKKYSDLDFVGIESVSKLVDASAMTHLHMDVWSPNFESFSIKLVDFGADGAFGGGDDKEHQVNIPMPTKSAWVALDIPLSDFTGLTTKGHLAQYILVAQPTGSTTVYVDNIYFYKKGGAGATEPTVAAPSPTLPSSSVISLFSDAYTNVMVDTWRTDWSSAKFEDVSVAGNAVKKYSDLDFVGIESVSKQINASEMTHFHMDVWSPNFESFSIKLVDFGADGAFGGGDDKEHQVNIPMPAKSAWVALDIPLSDFTGLTTKGHLAQYILVAQPTGSTTVYVDNIYFYKKGGAGATEPTVAAPSPTLPSSSVISLFSDAYTNATVDTWRTDWSSAKLEDVNIAGNAVKKYSDLDFVGIESVSKQINASEMTHFHMDVWSPNFEVFAIKLVDFGPDGAFGGGDDKEHQVNITMPAKSKWVSLDIPLSDFTGLTTKGHMAQYILVGQPTGTTTVFVDNVYFHK